MERIIKYLQEGLSKNLMDSLSVRVYVDGEVKSFISGNRLKLFLTKLTSPVQPATVRDYIQNTTSNVNEFIRLINILDFIKVKDVIPLSSQYNIVTVPFDSCDRTVITINIKTITPEKYASLRK